MKNAVYAFRYLLKARGSNITRVISLALGLIAGIPIFSYVNYQLTFNRKNKGAVFSDKPLDLNLHAGIVKNIYIRLYEN